MAAARYSQEASGNSRAQSPGASDAPTHPQPPSGKQAPTHPQPPGGSDAPTHPQPPSGKQAPTHARSTARKANRGPVAGPANRAALVAAAREVFEKRGLDAPLSAIAKAAGVGQGSLYRHFPDRISLAIAVFTENMASVEALAAQPETSLRDVVELVAHHAEGTAAIFPVLSSHAADPRIASLERHLRSVFEKLWDRGEGFIGPHTTVDDLMLAIAMLAGLAAHTPRATRHEVAQAAWELLRPGLAQ